MSDDFKTIGEARALPGLRLVLLRGLPSPWSQAAKAIFRVKGIAYQKVMLGQDEPRSLLREWTGQDAFPAAMYEEERARTGWEEILWLAERLAPTPSLIPADPDERVRMFGLARELCGEMGLGWCRRLMAMGLAAAAPPKGLEAMYDKYSSSPEEGAQAERRAIEILELLTAQLASAQAKGHRFLMGGELSALDLYWATFSNLMRPLSTEKMPTLAESMRAAFTAQEPGIVAALDDRLIAHRDFVYEEYLELPVEL